MLFWRFSSKGLGVDKRKRRTERGNGEKVEKGENEGIKLFERRGTRFDWQSPWTLFPLFPLFPVVQRLIKFVENVCSRTTIFKNKIVKIEEIHSRCLPCTVFIKFRTLSDNLSFSKKTMQRTDFTSGSTFKEGVYCKNIIII